MAPLPFYGWRAPPLLGQWNTGLVRAPGGPVERRGRQRNGIRSGLCLFQSMWGWGEWNEWMSGCMRMCMCQGDRRNFLEFYFLFMVQKSGWMTWKSADSKRSWAYCYLCCFNHVLSLFCLSHDITIHTITSQFCKDQQLIKLSNFKKTLIWSMIFLTTLMIPIGKFRTHWWQCSWHWFRVLPKDTFNAFPPHGISLTQHYLPFFLFSIS